MATIAFFEIEEWEKDFLTKELTGSEVLFTTELLEPGREIDPKLFQADILSTFAYSQVTREMLGKFPNLKYITTRSTGYDHIDLEYCKEKNIQVSNVPHYGVHTIAEHTFALLLALSRKIVPSVERTRKGDFSLTGLNGMQLFGKTLGVIGTGNIGSVVCDIALGLGMKVIAYNHHVDEELAKKGVQFVVLAELLQTADVVTIHIPLLKETEHLINKENILTMKKGSILINAARGGIVETEAILDALEKGILAGAGLDVLEEECNLREERELLSEEFHKTCDLKTQLMDHMLLN
ncbi:MAG: NAD(P)-dependent oxidoreductase, partial [Candidatus Levyibacteriota bacterium]